METINAPLFRLSRIIDVRWVSSDVNAMTKVFKFWSEIVSHLKFVISSGEFDKSTMQQAEELLKWMLNKDAIVHIAFNLGNWT